MKSLFIRPIPFLGGILWFSLLSSATAQQATTVPSHSAPPHAATISTPIHAVAKVAAPQTDSAEIASEDTNANPNTGNISGTVTDVSGDIVPGVAVTLDGPDARDHRETVAGDNAAFAFDGLKAGIPYHVRIDVAGFSRWTSPPIVLSPGQHEFLTGIQLKIEAQETSITVYASNEQLAAAQVRLQEQQRVLGLIPNFYVIYDSQNAVPLTTKLKYKLAWRVSIDPITVLGVATMAGINQSANRPDFVQGAQGYGQRFGVIAADGFSDILIAGAVLPSLLHQDPRYFYQGSGTTKSRLRHAIFSPFVCRGDNGKTQPNYSSLGGNLASSALSNVYYPESNRGVGLVFGTFAIGTAERMISGIAQEFVLPRLTPNATKSAKADRYARDAGDKDRK